MANVIKGYNLKDGLDVGGSANVAGALKVDGATTLAAVTSTNITASGLINVASTANVGGATNLRGTLTVNGATFVANTLGVGNTTITGFVNVSSSANVAGTLQVTGGATLQSTLGVTSGATFASFINVASTANVGGATTLRSTLDVTGATSITNTLGAGNTTVTGFTNVTSTIQVAGVATFGSGASVSGNLGVGTASPSTKLHVSGTGEQELRVSTLTSGNPIVSLRAEGINGGSIIYNRSSSLLQLDNAGGGGLNITTGGNVGVGVVPTYKLDVAGIIRSSSGTDGGAHFWGFSSASVSSRTWAFYNDYAAYGDFTLLQSSTQTGNPTTSRMYFDSSGNLGISEASPTSRLHVNGTVQARNGATGVQIYGDGGAGYVNGVGNFPVVFQINTTERMRFDTSGNIILTGNLIVSGTTTYVNTSILNVADNVITLNADLPGGSAPSENAGIEVNRGSSANTVLRWNESTDIWEVTNDGTTYGRIHSKLADVALGTDTSGNYVATVTNGNGISVSGSGSETAAVTVTAVTGNGMALDSNGIRALAGNTQLVSNTSGIWVIQGNIDHNSLGNYSGNRHIDHSAVSITAGNGLTGGGTITDSRTLDVGAANGIVVSADSVGVLASNGIAVDTNGTRVVAGAGIVVNVSGVSHADTSSVVDLSASARRYVTGLTFDTYGHVTGYTTGTETVVDTDTNTTYSIKASVQTGGAGIDLDAGGSGSGTDTVRIVGSGQTTVTRTDADTITIGSTDLYVGTVTSVSGGAGLTGSFSTSGSLDVGAGVGITVNPDSVAVNAQTGLIANTLGLYVDAGTISIGTMPTARLPVGTTTASGIIQLTDSISSTSTTTAATPNSVKTAYDLAATKAAIGQTMHIGTTAVAINRGSGSLSLTGVSIDGNAVTAGGLAVHASTNNEANKIVRTDGNGYLQTGYIHSAAGNEANNSNPPRVWGTNGSDSYLRTYLTSALSVSYAATAGGVDWSNVSNRPSNVSFFTNDSAYITTNGRAYPRRSDGTAIDFVYSGQSGQPTWLWGTGDGGTMYVWNPSNFSVNYATNAGAMPYTNTLLGYSASGSDIALTSQGGPQIQNQGAGAAMMSFHRTGAYAINFGLGTDNQLRVGGWSRGAASFVVLDSGNYTTYAPTLTGGGASGSWGISVTGSAGSVAWTNVSGRPTAVSSFTNDSGYITSSANITGSAGSVAWTNVTGRPTAVSAFTNDSGYVTSSGVTAVSATSPVVSSGGTTPTISMGAASSGVNGYMTGAYATKLDGIAAGATNVTNTNQLTNGAGFVTSSGVTSVSATSPVVSSGGTTPTISMGAASSGVNGYMTGTYATKLDGIAAGATNVTNTNQLTNGAGFVTSSGVTSVSGTAPIVSSGGTTPAISMPAASSGVNGYMTGTYATKLDGIAAGATNVTNTNQLTNGAGFITNNIATTMTATDFIISSDDRLKIRENNLPNALAAVNTLNGFKFTWNDRAVELRNLQSDVKRVGISAQEVEAILPEAVYTDDDGYKTVSYDSLVPLLIEAVKELTLKVARLEAE